jgi:hypothetical protein
MRDTLHAPDRRKLSWRDATANGERKSPARSPRLARPTIGFWLGGLLGTGGCILGACMPYHHPVAVVISVLWRGIYFGCFGASFGALFGVFTECTPAPSSLGPDGAGKPPTGVDNPAFPAGDNGFANGVNRATNSAHHSPTLTTRSTAAPAPGR